MSGVSDTLLRALSSFRGDVEAGVVEDDDHLLEEQIEAAEAFVRRVVFAENTAHHERLQVQTAFNADEIELALRALAALYNMEDALYLDQRQHDIAERVLGYVKLLDARDLPEGTLSSGPPSQAQLAQAHAEPHAHRLPDGREVGHHRLYALGRAGNSPKTLTCGIPFDHPPHDAWSERPHVTTYSCPGEPPQTGGDARATEG